ncbi:MAG: GGDEF domain-containing protein, partial [Actinomycetota bacterium]
EFDAGSQAIQPLTVLVQRAIADIETAAEELETDAEADFTRSALGLFSLGALSLIVAVTLARYITRPMDAISRAVDRLAERIPRNISSAGPREVRRVGSALTAAAEGLARVDRLEHDATHDDLTGVPTRELSMRFLDESIRRKGLGERGALMFVDLDDFKDVNDTHGHLVGDHVLRHVAQQLRSVTRTGDIVGRFGGDEFIVLIDQIGDDLDAEQLAARMLERVGAPVDVPAPDGLTSVRQRISIGIAEFDGDAEVDDVLHAADVAVYRAKRAGRHRYEFAEPRR